jgi:predicted permease
MESLIFDLRYSLRRLRKTPLYAAVIVMTLALGIGANVAIFSVVDAVLIRPLPFADPDRVALVWEDASFIGFPRNTPAPANYFDWKVRTHSFTDMAATRGATASLTGGGPPEQLIGRRVTGNFFRVLGVQAFLGRTFSDDDERSGAPVTVISYGLWQRRFGGDARIIGRDIVMNGARRTVIGVLPRGFVFRSRDVDFWNTTPFTAEERGMRFSHYLNVVGRLAPNVTLAAASDDVRTIARQLEHEYPDTNRNLGAVVIPVKDDTLGKTGVQLLVLLAASACVLLIACANIGSLVLSRGLSRKSEFAVQLALGADQSRIIRAITLEAMILAFVGGCFGLALAPLGVTAFTGLVPNGLLDETMARMDPRLLAFTIVTTFTAGLLFSLAPAVRIMRGSFSGALQHAGRGRLGSGRTIARDALVAGQVATAVLLLVCAGLLLRTLAHLRAVDLGFHADRLLTMRTTLPQPKYADPADRLAFFDRVIAGVKGLPGVENAAYISTLPFQSVGNTNSYRIEGRPPQPGQDSLMRVGTADYLKTIGVQVVEGRLPNELDGRDAPFIAVINETFARLHWAGQSPLGARVSFGAGAAPWRTIVGVVKDVRERGYELDMKPGTYLPYAQVLTAWTPESLVVRTRVDPRSLADPVRKVVGSIDPEQPIASVQTMEHILDLDLLGRSEQTTLLQAFAGLAAVLACLGLYGVLSYRVAERRREIGLRVALGATRLHVVTSVLRRGFGLIGVGLSIGALFAWAAGRAIASLLVGVGAADPATFIGVIALVCVVGMLASIGPAARASRIDPIIALREE